MEVLEGFNPLFLRDRFLQLKTKLEKCITVEGDYVGKKKKVE